MTSLRRQSFPLEAGKTRAFFPLNDKQVIARFTRAICRIFFSFLIFFNIIEKYKKLKKYSPYCTRHRAITTLKELTLAGIQHKLHSPLSRCDLNSIFVRIKFGGMLSLLNLAGIYFGG